MSAPPTPRIFVSHHHSPDEDRFTAQLVRDLRSHGADVWVDDQGITSDDFVQKISEGLAGRQWLVLVMTPAAIASPWVRREVNAALNEQTAGRMSGVLPVVVQPCPEQDIPMLWRPLHRYDATKDYPGTLNKLLGVLGLNGQTGQPLNPPLTPGFVRLPTEARPLLKSLQELGFAARAIKDIEVILPPLCEVPAGAFTMGSDKARDPEAYDDETPQYVVETGAYQFGWYPVTVAEYACAVRAKAVREPQKWAAQAGKLDHPVVSVSWHDVTAYAAWLAKVTDQQWRLPTEAEWEKAARGTDGHIYPWGDAFDKNRCNTSESGLRTTTAVGTYANRGDASPCGAHDVAGNVLEWTSSLFKSYPYTRDDSREGQNYTEDRVLRGGSWSDPSKYARAACRYDYHAPDLCYVGIGFRLVRAAGD